MRLATVEQAKRIDQISQSRYDLSGELLMEAAGALAAREIDLSFLPELIRGGVIVVCGPGNNGGDGLVVARHLQSSGHKSVSILLVAPESSRSPLFKKQLSRAEQQGLRILDGLKSPESLHELRDQELIVDALFGIGFRGRLDAPYLQVVEAINAAKAQTVSLDCPSGLHCDSGVLDGVAVCADQTLSFGVAKPGFFISRGPEHVGKLRVVPMGFPPEVVRTTADTFVLFTERLARTHLPVRKDSTNKSDHGHLLVIAGSPGYWGAGLLSSGAAYRMGAGYVTWASFEAPYESLREIPEVLTASVHEEHLWKQKFSAVAIGPGLEPSREAAQLIEKLKTLKLPVVVDAGGIQTCADHGLWPLPAHWVITPHSGELSRVLGISSEEIEKDRPRAVFTAVQKTGCHVLLKGYHSLVADSEKCLIVHAGNAALAKAGTGDILTGMIGALLAQGLKTADAAATAAYLHGRMADDWVRAGNDKSSLSASDLKSALPEAVANLRSRGGPDL